MKRLRYYGENTTLHGLKYVADEKRHPLIRIFWILVFVASVYVMVTVFRASYKAYEENAVSFVTETTYLDWNTSFPAITLCPIAGSEPQWDKSDHFGGHEIEQMKLFITDLIYFTGSCYSCNTPCSSCASINFTEYVEKYRKKCSQMVTSCKWNNQSFTCCDNLLPLETEYGICYSLNSLHTKKNLKSQLNLMMNRKTGPGELWLQTNDDVRVYFHAAEDVPFINSDPDQRKDVMLGESINISVNVRVWMQENSYTYRRRARGKKFSEFTKPSFLIVDLSSCLLKHTLVIEIENDDNVKHLPVWKRGCKFPWENDGILVHDYYSYSTCVVQCHAENHFTLCNCTHHLMPYYNKRSYCDITGLKCLTDNFETVNRLHAKGFDKPGLVCDCLPSCVEPEYKVIADTKGVKTPQSQVYIKMQALPTSRFKRIVVRTTMDLVVSIGGIAGLFIGASILSIVETVYLLFIRNVK